MARVKLNQSGFHQLRSAPGVKANLEKRAERVASAANATNEEALYESGSQQGAKRPQGRWRATVVTANAAAMASNAKHNTLIKSLEAGHG